MLSLDTQTSSSAELLEGLVSEGSRGHYWVDTPQGALLCTLRDRPRKQLLYAHSSNLPGATLHHNLRCTGVKAKAPVAVGDRVRIVLMGSGKGMIDAVLPRRCPRAVGRGVWLVHRGRRHRRSVADEGAAGGTDSTGGLGMSPA